jgi:hypothetical protein
MNSRLYVASLDKMYSLMKIKGLHVFIHNKSETPTYFEGFEVSVDTWTDVQVRRTFTEQLPQPFSACEDDFANYGSIFTDMFTEKGLTYSQTHCFEYCYQRKVVDTCGCESLPFFNK